MGMQSLLCHVRRRCLKHMMHFLRWSRFQEIILKLHRRRKPFFFKDICDAHKEALDKGITNSVASCTMYIELGRKLYMSQGSEKNLKLTTSEDIEIFKALLMAKKDEWMH